MKKKLRVLFIESSDEEVVHIESELSRVGYPFFWVRVDNEAALLEAIPLHPWDLVITAYALPELTGIKAIQLIHELLPEIPCLVVSDLIGEEAAVATIKAGAADFIIKGNLPRLTLLMQRELNDEKRRREKKIKALKIFEKEAQYRKLFESASDAIVIIDENRLVECNVQMTILLGMKKRELLNKNLQEISPEMQENGLSTLESYKSKSELAYQGFPLQFEWQFTCSDQSLLPTEITLSPFQIQEKKMIMAVIRDISDRKIIERNQKLITSILETLNNQDKQIRSFEKILQLIKEFNMADAVAIRLKKAETYPFFLLSGFPENFEALHTNPNLTEEGGQRVIGLEGQALYNCLCGSVIRGNTEHCPALFTSWGSFVLGSRDEFHQKFLGSQPCNFLEHCLNACFESIAIIPLKCGEEIIGTMILNDRKKNHFLPASIHSLEEIAAIIGSAIKRQRDEEIIRLNEEKMRGIIENSADAIILTDETGRITEWNHAAETMTGFPREEILGKFAWDTQFLAIVSDQKTDGSYADLKQYGEQLLRLGLDGQAYQLFPARFQKNSGEISYIQTRLFSIKTPQGHKIGSIIHDVTKLIRAQEMELHNMKALEILLDTATDFMGLNTNEDIYSYVVNKLTELIPSATVLAGPYNDFTETLSFDYTAGTALETPATPVNPSQKKKPWLQVKVQKDQLSGLSKRQTAPMPEHWWRELRLATARKNGRAISKEMITKKAFTIGLSDATNFYGLVVLLVEPEQSVNKPLVESFIYQCTVALAKQNMLSALQRSEQRFHSLFEQNNDILFTLDQNTNITSINPIGEKLLTGKFKPGTPLNSLLDPISFKRLYTIFVEAVKKIQPFCSGEVELTARNGSLLTFQVNFSITYHGQRLHEIFGIARNITTNKMLQNQVLSKIIETEEREKKAFADELRDGIGSLLSTVNIYTTLLAKKGKSAAEKAVYMGELRSLVNQAVSRVRLFTNSLTPNVLNDFGLVTAITRFCASINESQPGLITIKSPEKLPVIEKLIEINIYRIIIELINNSIKYAGARRIFIQIENKSKNLIVNYNDNGKGFDKDKSLDSEANGTGLKNILARAKSIGGTCVFESSPGNGVRVQLSVPMKLS